jgi:hypothetical protein
VLWLWRDLLLNYMYLNARSCSNANW